MGIGALLVVALGSCLQAFDSDNPAPYLAFSAVAIAVLLGYGVRAFR